MLDHRSSMDTATRPAATRAGARRACPLRRERPSPIRTARLEGEARQLLVLLSSSMFVTSWMIVSFFLFRLAHRCYKRDRCQCIRGADILAAVALQCTIDAEVIGEQSSGAALVPVGERVVLHDEVEQVSCFPLNARVQVLTGEGCSTAPRMPRNESLHSTRRTLRPSGTFGRPRRQRRAHSRSRAGQPTRFPVES